MAMHMTRLGTEPSLPLVELWSANPAAIGATLGRRTTAARPRLRYTMPTTITMSIRAMMVDLTNAAVRSFLAR